MNLSKLRKLIEDRYCPRGDYPCLDSQINFNEKNRPLSGLCVLHSTPIFFNFLPKILSLGESGASLTIVPPPGLQMDMQVYELLKELNFTVSMEAPSRQFDIVLDCAGLHSTVSANIGSVELTKSGERRYLELNKNCISVDKSKIKLIEDVFGTADGLMRALEQERLSLIDRSVVLFGFGKVGKGVYLQARKLTEDIKVVEKCINVNNPWNVRLYHWEKTNEVEALISSADVIITATGCKGFLREFDKSLFLNKTLINIGAEDEFGENIDPKIVFNNKKPANFILKEPTRLKYLDATFALHNQSAIDLVSMPSFSGVIKPLDSTESKLFNILKLDEILWRELCKLELL